MAKRRRRRKYGDYVSVPSLGQLPKIKELNPLGKTVRSTDLFVGAGLGLALGAGVKFALNKANVALGGKLPAVLMSYAGPISTFLAGAALYMFQKKNRVRATGQFVGASLAAATPVIWKMLGDFGPKMADGTPFFSDYVMTPYGLLTSDQPYGLLTRDAGFAGNEEWDPLSAP